MSAEGLISTEQIREFNQGMSPTGEAQVVMTALELDRILSPEDRELRKQYAGERFSRLYGLMVEKRFPHYHVPLTPVFLDRRLVTKYGHDGKVYGHDFRQANGTEWMDIDQFDPEGHVIQLQVQSYNDWDIQDGWWWPERERRAQSWGLWLRISNQSGNVTSSPEEVFGFDSRGHSVDYRGSAMPPYSHNWAALDSLLDDLDTHMALARQPEVS